MASREMVLVDKLENDAVLEAALAASRGGPE